MEYVKRGRNKLVFSLHLFDQILFGLCFLFSLVRSSVQIIYCSCEEVQEK